MCNTQQITEVPPKSATASVSLSVEDKLYLTILFYQYKRLLDSTTYILSHWLTRETGRLGETLQGRSWGNEAQSPWTRIRGVLEAPQIQPVASSALCSYPGKCKSSCSVTSYTAD